MLRKTTLAAKTAWAVYKNKPAAIAADILITAAIAAVMFGAFA